MELKRGNQYVFFFNIVYSICRFVMIGQGANQWE